MTTAYITHPRYTEHTIPGHPEHAGRIRAVWDTLESAGLTARMTHIEPTPVSDEQILTVHTQQYVDTLNWMQGRENVWFDHDTYAIPTTPQIARLSAGGVVAAVDAVLSGQADNALAAVRPPGHHAIPTGGMGFCILGNVPIAVRHAQATYAIKRVMVVDYDVHHGNGTQDMFYDDDSVLFISTHQSPFYPGTGALNETGRAAGRGYTLNVPLSPGYGDSGYRKLYEQVIWPAARRFQPELIMVSAGFDAHWTDPLALMNLTLVGYAHLTHELIRMAAELCAGRIVFVMEGGYDLQALGHGMRNVAHALLGDDDISDPLGSGLGNNNEPDVESLIQKVRKIHDL